MFSTENKQKLPISNPPPPYKCLRNIWMVPKSVAFVEASGCEPHQTSPNKSRPVQLASIKLHQSTELGPDVYLMQGKKGLTFKNGVLLPKLFWPNVRRKCSSDWVKLLKFEAEGQEFAKFLRYLEQFIQTVKGQNSFW